MDGNQFLLHQKQMGGRRAIRVLIFIAIMVIIGAYPISVYANVNPNGEGGASFSSPVNAILFDGGITLKAIQGIDLLQVIPSAPALIDASDGAYSNRVYVDWTDSSGATSYQVYRCSTTLTASCSSVLSTVSISNYNDLTVPIATIYYYRVKACNASGCSDFSSYNSGYRQFESPSTITASDGTYGDHVFIDWSSVSAATSYQVYRCMDTLPMSCGSSISIAGASEYSDYDAIPGITYYYRVKPCNSILCGDFSDYDTGYIMAVPAVPASISASDGTYTDRVYVDWADSANAATYQVYRCSTSSTSSCSSVLTTVSISSYNDSTVPIATIYYYRVKACNIAGCSDFSTYNTGYRQLELPSTITASDGSYADRVFINWSRVSGASSYEVYRCLDTSTAFCGVKIATVGYSDYEDYAGVQGLHYFYRVKPCYGSICADFSNYDEGYSTTSAPAAPLDVTASDGDFTDRIEISWSASISASSYELYRCIDDTAASCGSPISTSAETSFADYDITAETIYYYRVIACNINGCSSFSAPDDGFFVNSYDCFLPLIRN